ncbi:MAG: Hrp-dependent type III effector protein [Rhizobiales bacterium]|nr:Hrp-dependent type III effector protein [Hyphomicrobiales bacterium]
MQRRVGILADDLTGALDTAAAFTDPAHPIEVVWGDRPPSMSSGFAIDSGTRQAPVAEAEARVVKLLPYLLDRELPYKKIDSLMRGNTLAEIAACGASRRFATIVVAPAFPAQNRITRGGRQSEGTPDGWRPVDAPIGERLAARSMPSRLVPRGNRPSGGGVLVCDAESEADLMSIAAFGPELDQPILWCGSAGLARALSQPHDPTMPLSGPTVLALIGSRHPASLAQLDRLARELPEAVVLLRDVERPDIAVEAIAAALGEGRRGALAFQLPTMASEDAEAMFRAVFARLVKSIPPPDLLVISGGDTLARLAAAVEATRIQTIGEWMPGIAVSRFPDGKWRGTRILSKSGAFGDERLLVNALGLMQGRRGQ